MKRSTTIAQDLALSIERQIQEGAYAKGEKLPSLRTLSELHGYSKNTVVAAFEILVSLGVIEPRRGSGFYVLEKSVRKLAEEEPRSLDRAMNIVWMMREQFKTVQDAHPLGDGFPPIEWLSDLRLDKYHHKVVRSGMGTVFRYGNRFGYQPLREHLVRRLESFGIGAKPNQILMTQGANSAMDLVIRYFVPPGATVLVDDPGYYLLFGKLKLADAKIIGVPRLPDGPDLEALEQLIIQQKPRLFFTQSAAHNPTGTDLAAWKAFRVLKLAQEHNLLIVENDALADFKPLSATRLCALDQLERTIYIGSFSKSFSASLRVGFIACSTDLASELADLKTLISANSSEYCERTVDVILKEGHYDKQMVRLRNRVTEATELAYQALKTLGANIFGNSNQSLYLWASLPGFMDTHILAKDLQKKGILIAPGRLFCVDSEPACEWSRFNTGALADPMVFKALQAALINNTQKT
jgi:DNA-binding transcriptional MocR family regulator